MCASPLAADLRVVRAEARRERGAGWGRAAGGPGGHPGQGGVAPAAGGGPGLVEMGGGAPGLGGSRTCCWWETRVSMGRDISPPRPAFHLLDRHFTC